MGSDEISQNTLADELEVESAAAFFSRGAWKMLRRIVKPK